MTIFGKIESENERRGFTFVLSSGISQEKLSYAPVERKTQPEVKV